MSNETPKSPPLKKPGSAKRIRSANAEQLTNAQKNMDAISKQLADSPLMKATAEAALLNAQSVADSPVLKGWSEAVKRLDEISKRPLVDLRIPSSVYNIPTPRERPEIGLLRAVHEELAGMAKLLAESGRQTADMAEVSRVNLTALPTVVGELQEARRASARSDSRIFWLTVALVALTIVGAIAVLPSFVNEVIGAWSWVRSLR